MDTIRPAKRGIFTILLSIVTGAVRIACCMLVLGIMSAISHAAPFIRPLLWRLTLLGTWFCLFFEFVVRVPNFPFWSAMQVFLLCAALLWLDHAAKDAARD